MRSRRCAPRSLPARIDPRAVSSPAAASRVGAPYSKYGAIKTTVDGITFDSKAEANHYRTLKLLARAGEIRNLELQPEFPIVINGVKCGKYKADFSYFQGNLRIIVDVKGVKTPLYKFKKRIVEALYLGVKITEVK